MCIGDPSAVDWRTIGTAVIALAVFGVVYDRLYAAAEKSGTVEGYAWLWTAGGVLAVLVGVAVVAGLTAALVLAVLFAAYGAPMIRGEIVRYNEARTAAIKAHREEAGLGPRA